MRMADRHLVDKCLNGDSAAFGMLVDRYKESVYALAYSRLRNFHDAEDITQEAFIKAYQKLRTLRRWDEFYAWLYAITSNLCKNWIKARIRRPDREFVEDHSVRSLSYSMETHSEDSMLEVLHEALDSLPESYQQVLTLHYLGGMDGTEIAEFLGKSPSAIWQRLSRARASLKKEILDMMSETYGQNRLRAGFTFSIVEMVKRIRIDPVPPKTLPWGFSIASGVIIGIMCIGMNVNLTNTESYTSISSLSGESRMLDIGDFPVDVMRLSDIPVTSGQQLPGDGLGNAAAGMQNAFFMAPQAVGGTWVEKSDMPTARYSLSCSALNGKIYAIGGAKYDANMNVVILSAVEEYDPIIDKWIKKADMPAPRQNLSTSVVNGKIYAIGGWGGISELSTVEEYDPLADRWTKKADMPTPRQAFSTSVADGKIYAIGGWRLGAGLAVVEEYDPERDIWDRKADMPAPRLNLSTSMINGKIYAIGGITGNLGRSLSTLEEYDPIADKWTRKADMPTARTLLSTSVVNGKIYSIGGYIRAIGGGVDTVVPTIEEYDLIADKWSKKNDMPTARYWLSTSAVNGKIYAIGGHGNSRKLVYSVVEEYEADLLGKGVNFKGKLPTTWGEVRTASSR